MWEWRIFFPKEQIENISFYEKIKTIVTNSPLETRFDYYYIITDSTIGLKERGPSNSVNYNPKLELKIQLEKTDWGGEHWIKPFSVPIKCIINQEEGLSFSKISEILLKYQKKDDSLLSSKIDFLLNLFAKESIQRFKTKKQRKQISIKIGNKISTLEHTTLIFNDEIWETFEIECTSKQLLQSSVKQYFDGKYELVMGYPEFLIKHILRNEL